MSVRITCGSIDQAISEMTAALDAALGKKADKAIANALNRALAAGRKEAAREARKAYTAPIKKLFDNIHIQRARASNLQGELDLSGGKGVSLIHFKAQPDTPQPPKARPAAGVTAHARRGGSRHVWQGENGGSKSFIMKKKQGGFGVFVRHGRDKWRNKRRVAKAKYEMLFGPSPIQALQRARTQEVIGSTITAAFGPALQAQIDKALMGAGK